MSDELEIRAEKLAGGQVRRTLRIFEALGANVVNGLRLTDVAEAARCDAAGALRLLNILKDEGYTQRLAHNEQMWVLGPRLIQIALAFSTEMARARSRLAEIDQRYSREP